MSSSVAGRSATRNPATRPPTHPPPGPSPRDFAILGQRPGAPLAACIRAYDLLARQADPRRRPPDQQPVWLDMQNALDDAMAFIYDAARLAGGGR